MNKQNSPPENVALPDISHLFAQTDYIFALTANELNDEKTKKKAILLAFSNDTITLKQLLNQFRLLTKPAIPNNKHLYFVLNGPIDSNKQVKELKLQLNCQRLEGIFLRVLVVDTQLQYFPQNSVVIQYFIDKNKDDQYQSFYLKFELKLQNTNSQIIYLHCSSYWLFEDVIDKLFRRMHKIFGIKIQSTDRIIKIYYFSHNKQIKISLHQNLSRQKIENGETIYVTFTNPQKEQFRKRIIRKNCFLTIYTEGQVKRKIFCYDQISAIPFKQIYEKNLKNKNQIDNDTIYGLKIMDLIIKPEQPINKASQYFKPQAIKVVGRVITQKMVFYKIIQNFKKQFDLENLIIPQKEEQKRTKCRKIANQRALQTKNPYFQNFRNVQLITLYTSEILCLDNNAKKELKFYQSLNQFLRSYQFLNLDIEKIKQQWRMVYTNNFLKHLTETKIYNGTVWRGITYNPNISQKDINRIFTQKQFTSTSIYKHVAINFAIQYTQKQPPYRLYEIKLQQGKSIIEYSVFPQQGQILLEPYTQLQLISIENRQEASLKFILYKFKEIISTKALPSIKANFVITINPNPIEEKKIYQSIKKLYETTVFEYIDSTQNLKIWLEANKNLFDDETANLIFVTNMTRFEGNNKNQFAGIRGAQLIRTYSPNSIIYFFIGDIQSANSKLNKSILNMNKIIVSNQNQSFELFLKAQLT